MKEIKHHKQSSSIDPYLSNNISTTTISTKHSAANGYQPYTSFHLQNDSIAPGHIKNQNFNDPTLSHQLQKSHVESQLSKISSHFPIEKSFIRPTHKSKTFSTSSASVLKAPRNAGKYKKGSIIYSK